MRRIVGRSDPHHVIKIGHVKASPHSTPRRSFARDLAVALFWFVVVPALVVVAAMVGFVFAGG